MDVFMIVMTVVLAVLLIISNLYLLVYYCHPDDRGFGSGWTCKVVAILGMTLSWAQVLMLPLDVSNACGEGGEIRMDIFWMVVYLSTAVMVLFIIPALTYYYEADPDWSCFEKIKYSFCFFLVTVFVVMAILLVTYGFLSTAEVPITAISCSLVNMQSSQSTSFNISDNCYSSSATMNIEVSFPIYVIGFMSFISWFLFVIFGGIGLPALPLDFIYDFCTRPKKLSKSDMDKLKNGIAERAKSIRDLAQEVKLMETNEDVLKKGCKNMN